MASDPFELKRPHAVLDWRGADPVAREADDVYFSAVDGLAEARAVFVAGAGFPQRFSQDLTVVGELGFGTGLNFLALWQAFRAHAATGARLHLVSVEGYPLSRADAARALGAFGELEPLSAALLARWPSPHKGAHRLVFEDGRVTLTVFHDTVDAALSQMDFAADAWFLDGFAPAKNPDMWTPALFSELARLSKPGAPAATFTVAGAVRRGLSDAGFAVEKKPGFGRKRERLEAVYQGELAEKRITPFPAPSARSGPVAVIGGGIAAASLVEAFARRNRAVSVFAQGGWAAGASGAPLGLLTPRLEAGDRPHNRALLAAFDYARRLYEGRRHDGRACFEPTGVLRLTGEGAGLDRLERLAGLLDDDFSWDFSWREGDADGSGGPGLWMARAGVFDPGALVASLAGDAPAIDAQVTRIERIHGGAALYGADGQNLGAFETVIVAGGYAASRLLPDLALEATAGRIAVFDGEAPRAPTAWGGYAAPYQDGVLIGATHVKADAPETEAQAEPVLRALAEDGPLALAPGALRESWGGVRAALNDRLPAAGLLPADGFEDRWLAAARGAAGGAALPDAPEPDDGAVLTLTGLGARGFAHAPLLAEALVSALMNEPAPLARDGLEVLHPARFTWRALKRS
ncbi:MAG: tRNA (5-methylaminomethyl-2-thiouridine)(34)-methyltransferase MnmD [Oceanicaulis sp.]